LNVSDAHFGASVVEILQAGSLLPCQWRIAVDVKLSPALHSLAVGERGRRLCQLAFGSVECCLKRAGVDLKEELALFDDVRTQIEHPSVQCLLPSLFMCAVTFPRVRRFRGPLFAFPSIGWLAICRLRNTIFWGSAEMPSASCALEQNQG
jgi:hypothetical protein